MSNLSESYGDRVFGEHLSQESTEILKQLNNFVSEKHYLFSYYYRQNKIKTIFSIQGVWHSVKDFFWRSKLQQLLTFFILVCAIIITAKVLVVNVNNLVIAIAVLIYLLSFYVQFIIFLSPQLKRIIGDLSNTNKYIKDVASYDISNHLKYINNIGNNYSSQDIELEETRFKIAMLDRTRLNDIRDSFTPLVSVIYVLLLLWFFGNPQSITIAGVGIVPLLTVVLSFFVKVSYNDSLINQHCLFILQKASIIAKERAKQ